MGIEIVRLETNEGERWGVRDRDEVAVLEHDYASHRELMAAYFAAPDGFDVSGLPRVAASSVRLLAPVTPDIQIFCQGLNYASHREEGGLTATKGENLIFAKPPSSICGPNDDIVRPIGCELLDYEIELALIVKQRITAGSTITIDNLGDYVGGITLANDVSARDMMFGAPMMQWFKGKGYRTFCPTGPVLYLLDPSEVELLGNLHLTLRLNDEVRQDATTDQLIHKPDETMTEIASFADIDPGDMLLTGTPGGVVLNATPRVGLALLMNFTDDRKRRSRLVKTQRSVRYLEPGDRLELALTSRDGTLDLGRQINRVVDERQRS